jgi:hypothetical protein
MALEELSGIIHIGRGFLDRFEINTVLFDPSQVTVNTMVGALKRANTYIVLLRPVVTEVKAPELNLKVYPHENFYLPPAESLLIFEWKGEVNPKKGKFTDLSFDEIPPGVNLGESQNLLLNARTDHGKDGKGRSRVSRYPVRKEQFEGPDGNRPLRRNG